MKAEASVGFAHAQPVNHAILLTVSLILSYRGAYLIQVTVTITGLVCMVGWNGMVFLVQQSPIQNPWENRYDFLIKLHNLLIQGDPYKMITSN